MIEHTAGGTMFTGKGIDVLRLVSLVSALKLEKAGLKSRRFSARKLAKQATGLKTNDLDKLIAAVETKLQATRTQVTEVASAPLTEWSYRGKTYHTTTQHCPQCGANAVVPVPEGVDTSDGTTHVCNPDLGGCDMGYSQPQES